MNSIMDIETICRCCLSKDNAMKNMASVIDQPAITINFILSECLNVKAEVNDSYPQNICDFCINQLKSIYSFRLTILNSYKIFNYKYIKVELPEVKTSYNKESVKVENNESSQEESDDAEWSAEVNDIQQDALKDNRLKQEIVKNCSANKDSIYFYCTCCPSKFVQASELYTHCCEAHPPLNKKGDICEYCNELFPYPDILKKHKEKHLTGNDCPKRIRLKKRSVEKIKSKNWKRTLMQCEFCGKSLYDNNYYEHIKIHQEKQYVCKVCGKKFSQSRGFKTHMDSHSSVPKYKCTHCDKVYKFRKSLSDHVKVVHNKEKTKLCPTCDKGFFSSDGLKKHLLTHTGIKAHSCHLCDKAYQKKSALKVHLRSHNIISL